MEYQNKPASLKLLTSSFASLIFFNFFALFLMHCSIQHEIFANEDLQIINGFIRFWLISSSIIFVIMGWQIRHIHNTKFYQKSFLVCFSYSGLIWSVVLILFELFFFKASNLQKFFLGTICLVGISCFINLITLHKKSLRNYLKIIKNKVDQYIIDKLNNLPKKTIAEILNEKPKALEYGVLICYLLLIIEVLFYLIFQVDAEFSAATINGDAPPSLYFYYQIIVSAIILLFISRGRRFALLLGYIRATCATIGAIFLLFENLTFSINLMMSLIWMSTFLIFFKRQDVKEWFNQCYWTRLRRKYKNTSIQLS